MARKPPISKTVKATASQLKYLSMKLFIRGPNFRIKKATRKNRAPRLMVEAMIKTDSPILNAPEEMVMTLYGTGVNPAVNMIQKSYASYAF